MIMKITYTTPPSQEATLTRTESARLLALNRRNIDSLLQNHWMTLRLSDVAPLAARKYVSANVPLAVLRLGAPDYDHDGRRIGVAPSYSDEEFTESARKWWTGPVDQALDTGCMLVTTSSFIVGLLALESIEATIQPSPSVKRSSFNVRLLARVNNLVRNDVRVFETHPLVETLGHRIVPQRGSPLIVIAPGNQF